MNQIEKLNEPTEFDIAIVTAKRYPRNPDTILKNINTQMINNTELAEKAKYKIVKGGKSISGPSIYLAKLISQNWTNMRTGAKVISVEREFVVCRGMAWDLESNTYNEQEVRRSIMGNNGRYSNDMIVTTSLAANMIAMRNAIFAVIPANVISSVLETAEKILTKTLDTSDKIIAKTEQIISQLNSSFGVSRDEVLGLVKKNIPESVTKDDILSLISIHQGLMSGELTPEDVFVSKFVAKTNAEEERLKKLIENAKSEESLIKYNKHVIDSNSEDLKRIYNEKLKSFKAAKK